MRMNYYPGLILQNISTTRLYSKKRRAVQVCQHPHDPNPNAELGQRRAEQILSDLLLDANFLYKIYL